MWSRTKKIFINIISKTKTNDLKKERKKHTGTSMSSDS